MMLGTFLFYSRCYEQCFSHENAIACNQEKLVLSFFQAFFQPANEQRRNYGDGGRELLGFKLFDEVFFCGKMDMNLVQKFPWRTFRLIIGGGSFKPLIFDPTQLSLPRVFLEIYSYIFCSFLANQYRAYFVADSNSRRHGNYRRNK